MTNPNILYVRALDCSKSPHNVRSQSDPTADAELEANIGETGRIIQNLIGVSVPRKKGKIEIYGGGRRLDGVHANIASGKLADDFLVPVLLVPSAREAIAMSLEENYYNLRMNPADECRAFQTIIDTQKKGPADLAKRLGVTERFVLGRLRLANLAEPVFEALRFGDITLDVASAYASISDTDRQAAVYETMRGTYNQDNSTEIRRQLASFCYRGKDPKALLVGREAYVGAGGRIDQDLFSDSETESWIDPQILDHLAEDAMREAAAALAAREGIGDVRVCVGSHVPWSITHALRPIAGTPAVLTALEKARAAEIEASLAEHEARFEEEGATENDEAAFAALEDELVALTNRPPMISDEDRGQAIAYMILGADGTPRLGETLYRAIDPELEAEDCEDDGAKEEMAVEIAVARSGPSQKQILELAMMKTEVLAVHVAASPSVAINLGAFLMAEAATKSYGGWSLPTELRSGSPSPLVPNFASGSAAEAAWERAQEDLDRSWTVGDTVAERYDAFCGLSEDARAAWLAFLVARSLKAVPAGHRDGELLDHLGCELSVDVAAWWRPTAHNYFDRIRKADILDLFDEVGGAELRQRYAASKKHDLATSAEKLFAGDTIVEAEVKERAVHWIPNAMRFTGPTAPSEGDQCDGAVDETVIVIDENGDEQPLVADPGEPTALDRAA
jgi:ParB family chromosome partitioning protein